MPEKNLPENLLQQLQHVNGFDRNAFIEAHQQEAATSVRLHEIKISESFKDAHKVPWCRAGRYLQKRPIFTLDPSYHAGAYYVQEASSMFLDYLVRKILPQRKNLRVLDLCGAPGGKTTLISSLLEENSLLISNEVIRARASILEENAVRWGYTNTWVTSNDPKEFGKLEGYFDLIIVDAPCSGSGLFRKDRKALDEWSEANVQLCSLRQQRILADVWPSLKENGILIYATCSYSPQEDEEILNWLDTTFDVQSLTVKYPAEWGIVNTQTEKKLTAYRFFPGKINGEGFFIAAVQKKEATETFNYPKFKSQQDKKIVAQTSYLLSRKDFLIIFSKENFHAIGATHEADYHLLNKILYLRKTGLALGTPIVKEWLPAHDTALSIDRSRDINSIALNKEQALKFLKKEDFELPVNGKGWMLITYKGLGLGWIKMLGNRFNNYLPKHWRIRMELPDDSQ